MLKLERVYAYSAPWLSKPDLRITVRLLNRSRLSITVRRIRGRGDALRECWLSRVDFLILQSVFTRVDAEFARADQPSPRALPVKLTLIPVGFEAVVTTASKAPRWLRLVANPGSPPAPQHRRSSRTRRKVTGQGGADNAQG